MGNEADLIVNGLRFGLVLDAMDVGRRALRPCMAVSRPLRDGGAFARKMEAAFRTMWQRISVMQVNRKLGKTLPGGLVPRRHGRVPVDLAHQPSSQSADTNLRNWHPMQTRDAGGAAGPFLCHRRSLTKYPAGVRRGTQPDHRRPFDHEF